MSKKSTQKTKPWNADAVNNAQNTLTSTVNANQPQLQENANLINQNLPGLASKAFGADPTIAAGQGYAQDVLGGKYLNGNPFLDSIVARTNADVGDRVNSTFGAGGRTGGTQHVQALGRELGNSENTLRYNDYNLERDRMGQASASIPGLTASQFAGVEPFIQAAQAGGQIPLLGAQTLAQGTAGLQAPWNTVTQKKGLGAYLLDAATAAAMAYATSGGG